MKPNMAASEKRTREQCESSEGLFADCSASPVELCAVVSPVVKTGRPHALDNQWLTEQTDRRLHVCLCVLPTQNINEPWDCLVLLHRDWISRQNKHRVKQLRTSVTCSSSMSGDSCRSLLNPGALQTKTKHLVLKKSFKCRQLLFSFRNRSTVAIKVNAILNVLTMQNGLFFAVQTILSSCSLKNIPGILSLHSHTFSDLYFLGNIASCEKTLNCLSF